MTDTLHTTALRRCTRCLQDKPPTEFYKHKNGRGGLDAHCKACSRRPVPRLTCRLCGRQWTARTSGRPAKLCSECRTAYRVCFKCDLVKRRKEFHQVADNRARACKQCMLKPRRIDCQACGAKWKLSGSGVPPKLCPACEATLKVCHKCQKAKRHSEFNRAANTRTGLNDACRSCAQEWFRTRGAHLKRVRELRTKYNVSLDEWNAMCVAQDGKCACCRTKLQYKPALDHCHDTLVVRGILCSNCNTGLGKLGDNVEGLHRAETYLLSRRNLLAELTAGLHTLSEQCLA
jgi:hypothetical protein